jgi:hypothetical protein
MAERLVNAVKQHALGCKQHDDITVAAFGRAALGQAPTTTVPSGVRGTIDMLTKR